MSEGPGRPARKSVRPGRAERPEPSTPRWVKAFIAVGVLLVVAFVVLHLTGGGMGLHKP